jgi:hypothetical protein
MFEIECSYQQTFDGLMFFPEDNQDAAYCILEVVFEPVAYYPAEPDVGASDDFDAKIVAIRMIDDDANCSCRERSLTGASRRNAEAFLDAHHRTAMWEKAGEEVREQASSDERLAA